MRLFRGCTRYGALHPISVHALIDDKLGQVLWSGVIVLCPSEWVMR